MFGALALVSLGTGLFKGNLQVMVGNLYDNPRYEAKRDSAFSIFYMAINIGALFAPSAAVAIMDWAQKNMEQLAGRVLPLCFRRSLSFADYLYGYLST